MNLVTQPWPWYVSGPLIGLMVPALLILGNKPFGISSSLKHVCAACVPTKVKFFNYNWKAEIWNLIFVIGVILGGLTAGVFFQNPDAVRISEATARELNALGIQDQSGLVPAGIFSWKALLTLKGFLLLVVGGFCVGFGTRYADGCTSGHAIMGLSNLQFSSLIATCCFFAGGLVMTWFILPHILKL
ncbi:MAG TPA: YeeE/YedE thiosulfate transporter family protein [Bacteroidia bacterium]|jgi:uncharacterized membrane protein YedE/YeeE|nr:YeeE/YedE thiosulfate transporter family protein [Bacteroidia bacterium]